MAHPQTDIVVPVHNALEYVQSCLDTLFARTERFRLILVDDFSQPETTAYLLGVLKRQPEALYVRTAQQKWFTRASNLGLRMVRTPRAVLLNSDCVVDTGWLQELYDVWDEAAAMPNGYDVALVGSHQSEPEQRRWSVTQEPGYVTGHCFLMDMKRLGDMSERRGNPGWYFDEVHPEAVHINSDRYLCYEMNRAGFATVVSYKSAVGHHGGRSWNYDLGRVGRVRLGDAEKGEVLS